jgi:hypothetical protein
MVFGDSKATISGNLHGSLGFLPVIEVPDLMLLNFTLAMRGFTRRAFLSSCNFNGRRQQGKEVLSVLMKNMSVPSDPLFGHQDAAKTFLQHLDELPQLLGESSHVFSQFLLLSRWHL